jgi:hypothetical protein
MTLSQQPPLSALAMRGFASPMTSPLLPGAVQAAIEAGARG